MNRSGWILTGISVFWAATASAARLDGSVYLFPVGSSFRSAGSAAYYNDLNGRAAAAMSGEHVVSQTNGSTNFQATVQGNDGSYFYILEGPASQGNCFATWLRVVARPAQPPISGAAEFETTWNGPEIRCAPVEQSGCNSCGCNATLCQPSEFCPLILDLNADGIYTTGLDDPVRYWFDLQGRTETTAWTNPGSEEAFLWIDLDHNYRAQPTELFGSRMIAPEGGYHRNGFDALLKYDRPEFGGNGDGQITRKDGVWARLKLWVDRNHDAVSQPAEISVPSSHGIVALNLAHFYGDVYDEHGNELYLVGSYLVRAHGTETETRLMADIEFEYLPNG